MWSYASSMWLICDYMWKKCISKCYEISHKVLSFSLDTVIKPSTIKISVLCQSTCGFWDLFKSESYLFESESYLLWTCVFISGHFQNPLFKNTLMLLLILLHNPLSPPPSTNFPSAFTFSLCFASLLTPVSCAHSLALSLF